ncbi:MAG: TIGR01458 family HAD-type hydrolase [Myxococcales bacterium]|nr:TIGR01458 family HAD-type hydrolase [Deltaproteobacteria bacterium]NNK44448.1 TIGR01458 family HAD-type hydrolase [Myxococcales bacterium]NNL25530.1 TIGR01458 family HAD-type hydrolase [Myxococcales bacterium]
MEALLFDLDGVLYQGDRVIDGAVETLCWCEQRGIPHGFVTNTSSKPRRALVERLSGLGLSVAAEQIIAPPVAAHDYLAARAATPVALFIRDATREDFEGIECVGETAEDGAKSVVIGDIGEAWSFETLNRAFRLLMAEPRPILIALGMSRYAQGDTGLVLDVAPFIKALEHAASCEAVVMGKPSKGFFEAAVRMLGAKATKTVMVGDDIHSDVAGAQIAGLTGILVQTGKFRSADLDGAVRPDAVLDSVADLPRWWDNQRC